MKKIQLLKTMLTLAILVILSSSCAGKINTVKYSVQEKKENKKVYIIASENSKLIKGKPGKISMGAYTPLPDEPPKTQEVIGNTAAVLKSEFEKYGAIAEIVKKGDQLGDYDFLVEYDDIWRKDSKYILDRLELVLKWPDGTILSKSLFNIYKNKEYHNSPTPEKEVPKMVKQLMAD